MSADDDSFSSDSEDEFLTMNAESGGGDREAMIRQKLMESFYGKDAAATAAAAVKPKVSTSTVSSSNDSLDDDDDDDDNDDDDPLRAKDLDDPQFDAAAHTQQHVFGTSVHPLLEIEEGLACQVRTLDSSLQTLVYENYSRFIEATDAIRSIGVSVQANEANLQQLSGNLETISTTSRSLESKVGPLRDQVVEKLRVKRLLQRLDTLLKLPQTLRQLVAQTKYRSATNSYLSAYSILSKHSAGFESLQRIESDCQEIMTHLLVEVRHKLIHWSGGLLTLATMDEDEDNAVDDETKQETTPLELDEDDALPDPPQSIAEILECAGTPPLILTNATKHPEASKLFDPRLSLEQCQEMALSASLRYLERILDTHHIELQEQKLLKEDATLIPTAVLDNILQVCTLYSMSFASESQDERLASFVSMAFTSFLQHVRGELLELTMIQQPPQEPSVTDDNAETAAAATEEDDSSSEQIAAALSTLVVSVRQLASGLALPEVALSAELASSLVDQTVGLTEAMVRRRVDKKFDSLRLGILVDCLRPFCEAFGGTESSPSLLEAVQLASVALSDSLQLVDDTVRSILAQADEDDEPSRISSSTMDDEGEEERLMLQEAIEQSTQAFAKWFAASLERLAGYDSTEPQVSLQIVDVTDEDDEDADPASSSLHPSTATSSIYLDSMATNFNGGSEDDLPMGDHHNSGSLADQALLDLVTLVEKQEPSSERTLAIAELCRVAERNLAENLYQSINTHSASGGSKPRKGASAAGGLFSEDGLSNPKNTKHPISDRFRLAASRVLVLYAINRGHEAGDLLCSTLPMLAIKSVEIQGPRPVVEQVLQLVKTTSEECADLFGGPRRAGPPPGRLEDEFASLTAAAMSRRGTQSTSLAIDVERMFAETVVMYPHPNDILDFSRNALVTLLLKVAFKEVAESGRLLSYSLEGVRQWNTDMEFFKWYLPHYVKDEVLADGSNARAVLEQLLSDGLHTAKTRCPSQASLGEAVEETNRARAVLREYMAVAYGEGSASPDFVIPAD